MAQDPPPVGPDLTDEAPPPPRYSTFHSLRYPDFRYMWQGQIGASASQWMENVARPFLILELTDSPFLLGLVAATRMLPMLFIGVWAGVIADRVDKRKILLVCQSVTFVSHVATAALLLTGVIEPWMVFLGTLVTGSAQAFNQPARQSLIPRLVPSENMANAVALNAAAFNIMRTGGPAIAGLVLAFASFGDLYVLQSFIYVWVIWSTARITVRSAPAPRERPSMTKELGEGFDAVKKDRVILYIMILSLAMFVFGMPFQNVFIPLIALESLDMDRSSAALLISLVGGGALLGALVIATIGDRARRRGLLMIGMILTFSLGLMLFSRSESLFAAAPALLLCGAMQTSFMSMTNIFILGRTPPELHGRVLSLFSLDRGLIPFGATLAGALAGSIGPQDALMVMALIVLCSTLAVGLLVPSLRNLQ